MRAALPVPVEVPSSELGPAATPDAASAVEECLCGNMCQRNARRVMWLRERCGNSEAQRAKELNRIRYGTMIDEEFRSIKTPAHALSYRAVDNVLRPW